MNNQDQLFMQLIYIFHASAMQSMGKIKNPVTDKIERDMNQAKQAIDMLDMIKDKTKNNLSNDQAKMLDMFLSELRLNYVDESNKPN
jgi:hypothetical protein